ncbi:MAG: nitroreductase family protein [Planctomycetia bacterium]|jgi:nitroreductase
MNVYEAILARKSVRAYQNREVSDEILDRILDAARMAPSASNRQEWRFVVVRDPEMREKLAEAARRQMFIAEAPVVVACCAETDGHIMSCGEACYPIDVAAAIDHLTLAAVEEGLGTCWIGAFNQAKVKELLNIPPEIQVVELLPLGYPADPTPKPKQRLQLEEIVHHETW